MSLKPFVTCAALLVLCACPGAPADPEPVGDAGPAAECGNNVQEPGEECDDGNRRNLDGCSARCRIELGAVCGDGAVEDDEECDDGNSTNGDGCTSDCTLEGDGNDSFETAETITINRGFNGVIDPAGDVDYYKFAGEAGVWITTYTEANPNDQDELLDTVITLYDSEQIQLAENDNLAERNAADSSMILRLPYTGNYYLKVQDRSTWALNQNPRGGTNFTYRVVAATMNMDATQVNVDMEAGNDEATAQELGWTASGSGYILGGLTDAQDVDVYAFSVAEPAEGEEVLGHLEVDVKAAGVSGNGSTSTVGRIWITDAANTGTIARVRYSRTVTGIEPALPPGDYLLWVNHPSQGSAIAVPPGDNDFYVMTLRLRGDNVPEAAEETNNDIATPEMVELADQGGGRRSGFILAQLGADDVDHFGLSALETEGRISVVCRSRLAGSGIRSLKAELWPAGGGDRIAQDTEGAEMVYIQNASIEGGQDYVVKLTKSGQEDDVSGHWVRCGFHLRPAN
ncbi:MAG: hypothetical protein CMH55_04955 [Myxococcales bacterium]|nr:hypothetical protein [Myxococcales bacterium]